MRKTEISKAKSLVRLSQRVLTALPSATGALGGGAVFLMLVFIVISVASRYAFNRPLMFADEYSGYLLLLIGMLGLNYTLKTRGHVSVDLVVRRLPPRVANWLEVATLLVSLGVVIVLLMTSAQMAGIAFATNKIATTPLETPIGPVQLIMPIGLGLLAIQTIAEAAGKIKSLLSKAKPTVKGGG